MDQMGVAVRDPIENINILQKQINELQLENQTLKNILDQFQKDIDRGEFRDANYIYGPTIPRTYFAGLSLKL